MGIDRREHPGLGAAAAHGNGVEGARTGDHQTVERAKTGDDDKGVEHRAAYRPEEVSDGSGGALFHEDLDRSTAGQSYEIQDIDGHDNDRAYD